MEVDSALSREDLISLASQEVPKAIILEEKSTVRDLQVSICVEDIKVSSQEQLIKAEPFDGSSLPFDKPSPSSGKGNAASLDAEIQSTLAESVSFPEHSAQGNAPLEDIVKQLEDEVLGLKKKRADEGRANEKVVSIYASREQAWKAERRRFVNEQKRLWQELQRAFMEQEILKQRTRHHLSGIQEEGDVGCEECEQKEGWLMEMRERLREQEFVIMASMEEAKAEQHEKNTVAAKLATLEASFCEVNEKLRLEAEGHAEDKRRHEAALTEQAESCKVLEREKLQVCLDLECARKSLADIVLEKSHCEDLIAEMSTEIHLLQVGSHEKEDIISAMLKKADADAEEKHELERELAVLKAKCLHAESEMEKSHKYMSNSSPCIERERMKPRRSLGSTAENGFDKMRDLQRLHDIEIRELQSAFEEEVRLLKKRLSLFQERVVDLEENVLLRLAKNTQRPKNLKERRVLSYAERSNGLSVFGDHTEPDKTTQEFQLSIARTLLRQYVDTDVQRERGMEKWKNAYFASKATMEMLHKGRGHAASSPRNRGLGDWLELEKARFKLEQRHLQEINAFERQLKARDERMEAFRQQLLGMESEAAQRLVEIESLKQELKNVGDEKSSTKELTMGKD